MDRQATLGFVLIFVLLVVWMWMNAPQPKPVVEKERHAQTSDSLRPPPPKIVERAESTVVSRPSKFFARRTTGQEMLYRVETDYYIAEITSRGGMLKRWELKRYKTWDGAPVQLVDYEHRGDLSMLFTTSDGQLVNTRDLYFDILTPGTSVTIANNFEFEIILSLPSSTGGSIVKKFRFTNQPYGFETQVSLVKLGDVIANYEYQLVWEHGVRYAEYNSIDESNFAAAYAYGGKELTEVDAAKADQKVQKDLSGEVDWVAVRNKYFAAALIPTKGESEGAYIEGTRKSMPNSGAFETYSLGLKIPFKGGAEEHAGFRVYIGPLDHSLLKAYGIGLENIMSLGWAWLVRPISEYIMLPLLSAIHFLIPNWGLVIIVFSLVIKVALHPLTKSSMKSMKKTQALQPMIEELRVKYKDDPQKMNQAIMNLYKEYGVNPAGGCLPILLQLPILYALYAVFRASIELRQAGFVWWIKDLSIPDVAIRLSSPLPLLGIQEVSGIALIMGITMFIQQKMTVKDPRQKMMVWFMPIMMTLLFNSFPSGLNLYYTVFNFLSIGQQFLINKQHDGEPLRKVEPKKSRGGIFKLAKDLPRLKR